MLIDIFLGSIGIVVGVINSVAGGGMLVGFPALLSIGVPAISATATATIIVLPGQLSSAAGYRAHIRRLPKRYLLLLVPPAIGAAFGALLLRHTPSHAFNQLAPWLIMSAVGLFLLQPLLHRHTERSVRDKSRISAPIPVVIALFLLASIYGGYFGLGFGYVILALLGLIGFGNIYQLNGLKNLIAIATIIGSFSVLASSSLIDWHHGLIMAVGSIIGGYGGSRIAQRVPAHYVRVAVAVIGLATAAYTAFRS